ncbi:MAG: hypothetical protein DLM65_05425 [Candidatus Aeolococcus gillhamiae]|uniref:Uncharacterized protein n=1 Tax=Candidatus Aeolococcus gillhamiae TaxID=3127015 RepID=A0A2W5ZCJ9_9BACT|nr:MAG: hypothetical protein DLM65_05425 [Candidatus Dormibacter sp. RRmetagenome_bin12]
MGGAAALVVAFLLVRIPTTDPLAQVVRTGEKVLAAQASPTTSTSSSTTMVSAAAAIHGRLGSSGYIDAKQNRNFSEAASIAAQRRAQGGLGRVVVIHLGNNSPV